MSERSKNKKDFLYRINEFPDVQASPDFHERLHKKIGLIKSGEMKLTDEDDLIFLTGCIKKLKLIKAALNPGMFRSRIRHSEKS